MSMLTLKRFVTLTMMVLFLSACTSEQEQMEKIIEHQSQVTNQALEKLKQDLQNNQVRNASILTAYAKQLGEQRPELKELTNQLAKDATTEGPLYRNLVKRVKQAETAAKVSLDQHQHLAELEAIAGAAKASVFNDALSDPINVIADLSEGSLSRVNSISRAAELKANGAENFGAGAQMMGNPNYGQWRTDSSGMSFWEWYGMYSLFSNLFDNRRYSYSSWSQRRGYSYYNDYGRNRFTSPSQRKASEATYNRTKKSFASRGKSFTGPYSKRRVGSSSLSRASKTATTRSSFSKRSSATTARRSNYSSGSVRNSSTRTSRSYSRGK